MEPILHICKRTRSEGHYLPILRATALFPSYIQRLQASDSENKAQLELGPKDEAFVACAIAPASTRNAIKYTRPIIALDATHTKSYYRIMLYIPTTVDPNNNLLPIAWGLVPTENIKWWV